MKKKLAITILCALYSFLCAPPAHAQQVGLSISPPVTQILLSPNKKFTQAFTITNQGESGDFVINFHSITPVGNDGHAVVDPALLNLSELPLTPRLENADLSLGEPFYLESGKSQQIVISLEGKSINDTEDTYLALLVKRIASQADLPITTPGISALILTTLTGDNNLPVKLEISDFSFPSFVDSSKSLSIKATLSNQSHVMIRPEGKLQILNFRGVEVYQTELYNNLILKGSKRLIQGRNNENQPSPLTWSPHFSTFGPHTIRLTITTVGGSKILEVDRVVWFIPIRILIIFLLAVIMIILLIILKKRFHPEIISSH